MSLIRVIESTFDNYVDKTFAKKPTIHKYFKNHERKNVMFRNLADQIDSEELKTHPFTKDQVTTLAVEFSKQFCNIALNHARQQALTDLQKTLTREQTPEERESELIAEGFIEETKVIDVNKS